MSYRRLVSLGVGGTAFLVASALGFEVFGSDFPSVFYVLPMALLAAIGGVVGSYLALGARPGRGVRSGLSGVAAVSYAFFLGWFVRYSVAVTRAPLSFDRIVFISVGLGIATAVLVWVYEPGEGSA